MTHYDCLHSIANMLVLPRRKHPLHSPVKELPYVFELWPLERKKHFHLVTQKISPHLGIEGWELPINKRLFPSNENQQNKHSRVMVSVKRGVSYLEEAFA